MIYRAKCDKIIFEFSVPEKPKGTIVLCDGMPSVPKQKELMERINENGFAVIYPRYRGTWESEGEFLARSPSEDIKNIIDKINKQSIRELYAGQEFYLPMPFCLLGSSFGGSVALCLADEPNVSKIFALSPIVDFTIYNKENNEQDLLFLRSFLRNAFPMGYRFSDNNWNSMMAGELFNPKQEVGQSRDKITVVYDKSDTQVNYKHIEEYCLRNSLKTIQVENLGHLSFSKISDNLLKEITKI